MKDKLTIGQTIYSLNIGNAAINCEQKLTPVKVTKIGRKYFTVVKEGWEKYTSSHKQYYINTWRENTIYSPNSQLYLSKQDWADDKEYKELRKNIENIFRYYTNQNLTLNKLREIKKIIES